MLACGLFSMSESVLKAGHEVLAERKQKERDAVRTSQAAVALYNSWQERKAVLLETNSSLNGFNQNALAAEARGISKRGERKPYSQSVFKNDSSLSAVEDKYLKYIAAEDDKIESKYAKLNPESNGAMPLTGSTAFVFGVSLAGIGAITLLIKMHRENPSFIVYSFKIVAVLIACATFCAEFHMLRLRLLPFGEFYAMFGAISFGGGNIVFTVLHHYVDVAKLHSERQKELDALLARVIEEIPKVAKEEKPKNGGIMEVMWRDPLKSMNLSQYRTISDLPHDVYRCCEIYAAFEIQRGRAPEWMAYSKLSEYLKRNGVNERTAKSSISEIVTLIRRKKAA